MSATEVITHSCPNCGGSLVFQPQKQLFACDHCLSEFTEKEILDLDKHKDESQPETQSEQNQIALFLCPNCGAQITTDETTAATSCFYCHSPVVLKERISGKFLPEKVLPFQIDEATAKEEFLNWIGKKRFIPKGFLDKQQVQNLKGVYFPYFLVDSTLHGNVRATGTTVNVWRVGDTEYTETKKYDLYREGNAHFKEFIQNALQKNEAEKMVKSIQPFDYSKTIPFENQYLSGFFAEKRDIEFEEMKERVDNELEHYTQQVLLDTASGYAITNQMGHAEITAQNTDYILLPVWLVTYRNVKENKLYYYAMNGQTGKTSGILPVDKVKLAAVSFLIFLVCGILAVIGAWSI